MSTPIPSSQRGGPGASSAEFVIVPVLHSVLDKAGSQSVFKRT